MYKQIIDSYKDSIIYGVGSLANKFVGFLLLPVYTSYFSLAKFGVLGLIEPIVQFLFVLLGMGITSAFMRWYATSKDETKKKEIFFNSYILVFAIDLFFLIILILFSKTISLLFLDSTGYGLLLKLAFLNVFFTEVNAVIFMLLRIEKKALMFSGVKLAQFTLILALNILFLVYLDYGLISIFISQVIGSFLVFIFYIPQVLKHSTFRIKIPLLKEFLLFSLPLVPIGISNLVINFYNRLLLEKYIDMDAVGMFTFSYRLSNTTKILIVESLSLSLMPVLYNKLVNVKDHPFIKRSYVYSAFIVMLVYLYFSSFGREVVYFFAQNEQYYDAYLLLPVLGIVNIFSVLIFYHNLLLGYEKKTKTMAAITIFSSLLSLLLNYILIPPFGNYGAAFALVGSMASIFFLTKFTSTKNKYGNFYPNKRIVILVLTGLVIVTVNFLFFMDLSWSNFIIKFFICLLFPLALFFFGFFEPIELERIKFIALKLKDMGMKVFR